MPNRANATIFARLNSPPHRNGLCGIALAHPCSPVGEGNEFAMVRNLYGLHEVSLRSSESGRRLVAVPSSSRSIGEFRLA